MTLVALLSLAFSLWMAWTLYASVHEEKLSGYYDWISTIWIGGGSLSGILVAAYALVKVWF